MHHRGWKLRWVLWPKCHITILLVLITIYNIGHNFFGIYTVVLINTYVYIAVLVTECHA